MIKVNNQEYEYKENINLLEFLKQNNIFIPNLCYLKNINEIGACRLCLVQINKSEKLTPACTTKVVDGMEIITENEIINNARIKNLELIVSNHNYNCDNCLKNSICDLQKLVNYYHININKYSQIIKDKKIDNSSSYLQKDNSKCILCNKCVAVCNKIQGINIINKNNRGINSHVGCAFDTDIINNPCIACGQCTLVCPTGALMEKDDTALVKETLKNKRKHLVCMVAPAVRVALGECFDMPIGTNVKGEMVTALKKIGFDKVFDVNFGADLTIMEEANELLDRINNNGPLPMFTSCSPGWIKYVETYVPELIPNLSTCKSPQEMMGAIIKSYYAEINKIKKEDIILVSIMPCIAKKLEKEKNKAIDIVLTTRELGRLLKDYKIDLKKLEKSEFDNPLGYGGSVIFGTTGGVMESAIRSLVKKIDKKDLSEIVYNPLRNLDGIKEATVKLNGNNINIAIASSIKNAKKIIELVKRKEKNYHFIEIMTCPGGCINGGGQPQSKDGHIKESRSKSLIKEYETLPIIISQDNPNIIKIYKDYLKKPGSKKAHELLHTSYEKKNKY